MGTGACQKQLVEDLAGLADRVGSLEIEFSSMCSEVKHIAGSRAGPGASAAAGAYGGMPAHEDSRQSERRRMQKRASSSDHHGEAAKIQARLAAMLAMDSMEAAACRVARAGTVQGAGAGK